MVIQEKVGPTDMGPPKALPRSMIVKVHTDGVHARITTIDGSVHLIVPAAMVLKRLRPGEDTAFFRATSQTGEDVIELDERIEGKSW